MKPHKQLKQLYTTQLAQACPTMFCNQLLTLTERPNNANIIILVPRLSVWSWGSYWGYRNETELRYDSLVDLVAYLVWPVFTLYQLLFGLIDTVGGLGRVGGCSKIIIVVQHSAKWSLIPMPPVFDHLQYAKWEGEASCFCILQAINNWSQERPGNEGGLHCCTNI